MLACVGAGLRGIEFIQMQWLDEDGSGSVEIEELQVCVDLCVLYSAMCDMRCMMYELQGVMWGVSCVTCKV